MSASALWKTMWLLLAVAGALFVAGLAAFGTGLGTPLLYAAAILLLASVVVLRMWMWQRAYEGRPSPGTT